MFVSGEASGGPAVSWLDPALKLVFEGQDYCLLARMHRYMLTPLEHPLLLAHSLTHSRQSAPA
jgi:hypothetical protein